MNRIDLSLSGFVKASVAEERQADAIKAAVASERERRLAPLREWMADVKATDCDFPTCAKCGEFVNVGDGLEWDDGDVCGPCASALFQVVAKLLRDSGADAPGAGKDGGK